MVQLTLVSPVDFTVIANETVIVPPNVVRVRASVVSSAAGTERNPAVLVDYARYNEHFVLLVTSSCCIRWDSMGYQGPSPWLVRVQVSRDARLGRAVHRLAPNRRCNFQAAHANQSQLCNSHHKKNRKAHAGRSPVPSLPKPLVRRATLCLAALVS